jgi:hypothetical protein
MRNLVRATTKAYRAFCPPPLELCGLLALASELV